MVQLQSYLSRSLLLSSVLLALPACSSSGVSSPTDAGSPSVDAGLEAGLSAADAGTDAGSPATDAAADAGALPVEAGCPTVAPGENDPGAPCSPVGLTCDYSPSGPLYGCEYCICEAPGTFGCAQNCGAALPEAGADAGD